MVVLLCLAGGIWSEGRHVSWSRLGQPEALNELKRGTFVVLWPGAHIKESFGYVWKHRGSDIAKKWFQYMLHCYIALYCLETLQKHDMFWLVMIIAVIIPVLRLCFS